MGVWGRAYEHRVGGFLPKLSWGSCTTYWADGVGAFKEGTSVHIALIFNFPAPERLSSKRRVSVVSPMTRDDINVEKFRSKR